MRKCVVLYYVYDICRVNHVTHFEKLLGEQHFKFAGICIGSRSNAEKGSILRVAKIQK